MSGFVWESFWCNFVGGMGLAAGCCWLAELAWLAGWLPLAGLGWPAGWRWLGWPGWLLGDWLAAGWRCLADGMRQGEGKWVGLGPTCKQ